MEDRHSGRFQKILPLETLEALKAPNAHVVCALDEWCRQGRFLQARDVLSRLEPPEGWEWPEWQVVAARIFYRVGEPARARKLIRRVWRRHPGASSPAREEMLWLVFHLRGPFTGWEWWCRHPVKSDASRRERSDDLGWGAYLLGLLRDFEQARGVLSRAMADDPDNAWLQVVSGLLDGWQDRPGAALGPLRRALELAPDSVGAVHALADGLVAVGRDAEALEVLEQGSGRLEAASLAVSLVLLQLELSRFAAVSHSLDRHRVLTPWGEAETRSWREARWRDHASGDDRFSVPFAAVAGRARPLVSAVAPERARQPGSGVTRCQLPVGFVRQQHHACAPAVFSTLARYWHQPVDPLGLAEAVCYDGTPSHGERRWAEANGWATREFTVTSEAARMLIDRGLPFALSTVQPGNGHRQAVIGYDDGRGVLLLRDPCHRARGELLMDEGLAQQASSGPRGLVMVPRGQAARLHDLLLPEAALHDLFHSVQSALAMRRRPAAGTAWRQLVRQAPGHRLALEAAYMVACYDGRPAAALTAVEALLGLFPAEVNWQLRRLQCLTGLEPGGERLRHVRAACQPAQTDPLLWLEWARALLPDARRHAEAARHLRRCLRHRVEAWAVHTQAVLLWQAGGRDEALARFRLAACLDNADEALVLGYFRPACALGRSAEALRMLRERFARDGARSSGPARSLFQAHVWMDQADDGFAVLAEACRRRPQDAGLVFFQAHQLALCGRDAEAGRALGRAPVFSGWAVARSRVLGVLAMNSGRRDEAGRWWRQVLAGEPLAMDAHRALADLAAESGGPAAALRHLRAASRRHPHHLPLHQAIIEWARLKNAKAWEQAARHLLHSDPMNAPACRDLAEALQGQGRLAESRAAIAEAAALDPLTTRHDFLQCPMAGDHHPE